VRSIFPRIKASEDQRVMKTFVAEVRCNGKVWILQVPAVDYLSAQAGNLLEAEDELRAVVARRLGIEQSDIAFELQNTSALQRIRHETSREPRTRRSVKL
jgi:hypothetical protein